MTWSPGEVRDLADALSVRALTRCASTMAISAAGSAALCLLFVQVADGRADARSLPPLLVLGWAALVALVAAGGCALRARAVGRSPGTGPGHASGALTLVARVVVAVPVGAVALAVVSVVLFTPRDQSLLSALVAVAVSSQVALLAVVRRAALRRAATLPD